MGDIVDVYNNIDEWDDEALQTEIWQLHADHMRNLIDDDDYEEAITFLKAIQNERKSKHKHIDAYDRAMRGI